MPFRYGGDVRTRSIDEFPTLRLRASPFFTKEVFNSRPYYDALSRLSALPSGAGELIAEGVLAIEMGANATDLKLSIHPHPTLTETMMESAEVFFGQATHVYRPKRP